MILNNYEKHNLLVGFQYHDNRVSMNSKNMS